jgi:hypothetical protein
VTSSTSAQWFISEQHPKAIDAQSERKVFVIPTAQLPHERLHFGTRRALPLGE